MSGIFSWLRASWLALLIGIVVGRFVLSRVV
jgi:hypothetical protein